MLLFRDLLIGVTTFFRDADAFEAVKRVVVPRLFEGKGANDAVRVWVPGCATGEEAYSLAILLREHMDGLGRVAHRCRCSPPTSTKPRSPPPGPGAIPQPCWTACRRSGASASSAAPRTAIVVSKEIRDLCTFSAHSLIRDPPFSRMNLVSCRNLLIYMDADLQASVIPAFHYSLAPGGVLLLGSSETVTRHEGLFAPLEKEHRIFQRRDGPSPPLKAPHGSRQSGPAGRSSEPRSGDARSPEAGRIGRGRWRSRPAACWNGSPRPTSW